MELRFSISKKRGGTDVYKALEYMCRDSIMLTSSEQGKDGSNLGNIKMVLITNRNPTAGIKNENKIVKLAETSKNLYQYRLS
jgi:hypothetical protein